MRKPFVLLLALFGGAALAAGAGVTLITGTRFEFTNCSSGGSAAQTVTAGKYLFRVLGEDTAVCYDSTCAANGEWFPAGTVLLLTIQNSQSISCRSSGSTGDVIFTRGE